MPQIHSMLKTNKQVLLVGGAGTGKTTIGKQLNAKLGHDEDRFYPISLSAEFRGSLDWENGHQWRFQVDKILGHRREWWYDSSR